MTTGLPLDATSLPARQGLRDRVYDLVLDMLMGSAMEPGSRLAIDQIARDLHVSPTPVREALVQLERTGLVAREAHKGYRVAPPIAGEQLEALFDARIVLEGGATALAAADPTLLVPALEDALAAHEETTRRVRAATGEGEMPVGLIREYFVVDWDFHHRIFEATGTRSSSTCPRRSPRASTACARRCARVCTTRTTPCTSTARSSPRSARGRRPPLPRCGRTSSA